QRLESGIVEALVGAHVSEVTEHDIDGKVRKAPDHVREFVDVHQELDMPAVRLDAPCQTLERGHIEDTLSFGNVDDVDAHTAYSCFMHALDFGIGDVVFD